jgi:AcrR family transcriptional regulator
VSPSAVYRHFEDKAALVAAVVDDGVARMVRAMETAARTAEERARGDPGRAAFVAMGMAYVRFAGAHPAHFRAMFGEGMEAARRPHELLARALDRLLGPRRSTAERRAARRAAIASVHGLAILITAGPAAQREPSACDAAAREVLDVVLAGLLPAEGAGGQRGTT